MPTKLILVLFCICLGMPSYAQSGATAAQARRIRFANGATTKTIAGTLSKSQPSRYFKIKTRTGQRLSIKVAGTTRGGNSAAHFRHDALWRFNN